MITLAKPLLLGRNDAKKAPALWGLKGGSGGNLIISFNHYTKPFSTYQSLAGNLVFKTLLPSTDNSYRRNGPMPHTRTIK